MADPVAYTWKKGEWRIDEGKLKQLSTSPEAWVRFGFSEADAALFIKIKGGIDGFRKIGIAINVNDDNSNSYELIVDYNNAEYELQRNGTQIAERGSSSTDTFENNQDYWIGISKIDDKVYCYWYKDYDDPTLITWDVINATYRDGLEKDRIKDPSPLNANYQALLAYATFVDFDELRLTENDTHLALVRDNFLPVAYSNYDDLRRKWRGNQWGDNVERHISSFDSIVQREIDSMLSKRYNVPFNNVTNYNKTGTHNGSNGAATLLDTTADFVKWGVRTGDTVSNTTDGSSGIIISVTKTEIRVNLSSGTDNDWDNGDTYTVQVVPPQIKDIYEQLQLSYWERENYKAQIAPGAMPGYEKSLRDTKQILKDLVDGTVPLLDLDSVMIRPKTTKVPYEEVILVDLATVSSGMTIINSNLELYGHEIWGYFTNDEGSGSGTAKLIGYGTDDPSDTLMYDRKEWNAEEGWKRFDKQYFRITGLDTSELNDGTNPKFKLVARKYKIGAKSGS
jgi:hypothetical protein